MTDEREAGERTRKVEVEDGVGAGEQTQLSDVMLNVDMLSEAGEQTQLRDEWVMEAGEQTQGGVVRNSGTEDSAEVGGGFGKEKLMEVDDVTQAGERYRTGRTVRSQSDGGIEGFAAWLDLLAGGGSVVDIEVGSEDWRQDSVVIDIGVCADATVWDGELVSCAVQKQIADVDADSENGTGDGSEDSVFGFVSGVDCFDLAEWDDEVDADAVGKLIECELVAAGLDSLALGSLAGGGSEESVFGFAYEKQKLILFDNDAGSIGLDNSLKIESNSVTSDVSDYVRAVGFGPFVRAGHCICRNIIFDDDAESTCDDADYCILKIGCDFVTAVIDGYIRMADFVSDILYDPGGVLLRSLFALFTGGLLVCSVFGSLIRPEMSRSVKFAHELPHDLSMVRSMMSMVDYELWSFGGLDV